MLPPGRKVCYPAEVRCQPRSTSVQRDKSAASSTHRGTGQTHRVAIAVEEGLQPTRGLPGDRDRSSPMRRYRHLAHYQSGKRLDSSEPRVIVHFEKEKKKRVAERRPDQEITIVKTEHLMSFAEDPDPKLTKAKPKKRISLFVEKKKKKRVEES